MEFNITLPINTKEITMKELLEKEWLVPRKVRHFLRTRKNVLINGDVAMFHQTVNPGDTITIIVEDSDYTIPDIILGNKKDVDVLWEDEHIIIVNKPAGKKTHPNQPNETDTLLNDVADYLQDNHQSPYVVHRLDKETSGAILFAKNPVVLPILGRMLEQKDITRLYEAKVQGNLNQTTSFTIDQPIGRHRHDRRKRVIDKHKGDKAITHVCVIKQKPDTTLIECQLDTGRTHQIRVHLESIGHPIVGDPLYHPNPKGSSRLQLHAKELSLIHPFTKEKIVVKAKSALRK